MNEESESLPRPQVWLYASIAAVLALAAGVSAISADDPDGVWWRLGMILVTVAAAMWLPWPTVIMSVVTIWVVPNFIRGVLSEDAYWSNLTALEAPGLLALGLASVAARYFLRGLEEENAALSEAVDQLSDLDPDTGLFQERGLVEAIEAEMARSRRFDRGFAFMLARVSDMHQRFDYRDESEWKAAFGASATVLKTTRARIDRVYHHGERGFALILPETGQREVSGLVRRLIRTAKRANPSEGDPGGPLPMHFGVTFFPQCATTVEDLLRRAEIVMRLAEKSPTRLGTDSAEAPSMPLPETLRRPEPAPIPVEPAVVPAAVPAAPVLTLVPPPDLAPAVMASVAPVAAPAGEAVAGLLGHLDETLELIRKMRAGNAA